LNCNTGNFRKKYGGNRTGKARKLLKKRDFLMESPAPLLQRYNIFGPKARNVKNDGALLAYIQKGGFSASFFRKTGTKNFHNITE